MGDCLSSNNCSSPLSKNTSTQPQNTKQHILIASVPPSAHSSLTKPSLPDICIIPPDNPAPINEREPSLDLREPPSPHRSSRSSSFSLGQVSQSNRNSVEPHTDSQILRKLEEARRSSIAPVHINPTQSYLVDGGRVDKNDVTLQLIDGEILVSRAGPVRQNILETAIFGKEYGQSREEALPGHPVMEQSTVIVHTKPIPTQNEPLNRPNIEQSAVVVDTRVVAR